MNEDRCDLLCVDAPRAEEIRKELLGVEVARDAAERARSDPTPLMLAAALREGEELCVCDLAWISGRTQKLIALSFYVLAAYVGFEPEAGPIRLRMQGPKGAKEMVARMISPRAG
jgi:hypothetical protein